MQEDLQGANPAKKMGGNTILVTNNIKYFRLLFFENRFMFVME
jgi:hypothetical protein